MRGSAGAARFVDQLLKQWARESVKRAVYFYCTLSCIVIVCCVPVADLASTVTLLVPAGVSKLLWLPHPTIMATIRTIMSVVNTRTFRERLSGAKRQMPAIPKNPPDHNPAYSR